MLLWGRDPYPLGYLPTRNASDPWVCRRRLKPLSLAPPGDMEFSARTALSVELAGASRGRFAADGRPRQYNQPTAGPTPGSSPGPLSHHPSRIFSPVVHALPSTFSRAVSEWQSAGSFSPTLGRGRLQPPYCAGAAQARGVPVSRAELFSKLLGRPDLTRCFMNRLLCVWICKFTIFVCRQSSRSRGVCQERGGNNSIY
jgi:hypothetical protein